MFTLPAVNAVAQSTTVKFTAPGGFTARYVIVQFTYPDWSPYGDPITSGFGTTVYLTNGQSYFVTKNMRYTGPDVSVVGSWREDYSGSPANAAGSATPTAGGTVEFYTGSAPPDAFYIKVDLYNLTQCVSTQYVVQTDTDLILGTFFVPAGTRSPKTVILGPYTAPFPWQLWTENACTPGVLSSANYGTNGFVTSTGAVATATSTASPSLPPIVGNSPDTTNITFSTNGTAGARDQTMQEGFSALRSVVQQGNDRAHNDSVSIAGKLDNLNATSGQIRDSAAGIYANTSNTVTALRGMTNANDMTWTNGAKSALDGHAAAAESAMLSHSNAFKASVSGIDAQKGVAEGKAADALGSEVIGDPSIWLLQIGGETVDVNPRLTIGPIMPWLYNVMLVGMVISYLTVGYKIAFDVVYRTTQGSMGTTPIQVESIGSPLTAPFSLARIVARFTVNTAARLSIVVILAGLPGIVMAAVEAKYGTAASLSSNPFYSNLTSPAMREGVALLAECIPLRSAVAFAFGTLALRLFGFSLYQVTVGVLRSINWWASSI